MLKRISFRLFDEISSALYFVCRTANLSRVFLLGILADNVTTYFFYICSMNNRAALLISIYAIGHGALPRAAPLITTLISRQIPAFSRAHKKARRAPSVLIFGCKTTLPVAGYFPSPHFSLFMR